MRSQEFLEYEREFKKYTDENLRMEQPQQDYAELLTDEFQIRSSKLSQLALWWREAQGRVVVFTGAGISTAAGLPDYRGPNGLWTRKLRGEAVDEASAMEGVGSPPMPTAAHLVLARLHDAGLLAHVATTNVDGLHRSSGLPADALSELHGNGFVEECCACLRRFERDFSVRTATALREHLTGRSCEECSGALRDIIVNFGNTVEEVPSMEAEHDRTWMQCLNAELVVVFGSSLSVPTACDLPEECLQARYGKPNGGRLVVVNRQRTPKDTLSAMCIHAACDDVLLEIERLLLLEASSC